MGVPITDILSRKEISVPDIYGKVIAVDAYNHIYQFLSTIRQRDGTPLMDSKGGITSHLSGLFSRTANLMERNVRLVYVFDGKAPDMKRTEQERRQKAKHKAEAKYKIAVQKEDIDGMRKYASRTSRLTAEMIEESKSLLTAMGVPIVQAPSEGEAQAAHVVREGHAYAVASQDADSLLFGTPLLIRNLSISGRRKKASSALYEQVSPELVDLEKTLAELDISQDQLIALALLVGTDYNSAGIKGIGPKKALQLVKEHANDFDALFSAVSWSQHYDVSWKEIFRQFKEMPVTSDYTLNWRDINDSLVIDLLVGQHDFSNERVSATLDKLHKAQSQNRQKGLGEYF